MYRKAWCTCKPVVLLNKPIAVLTVLLPSPSSLLKLPNKLKVSDTICTWAPGDSSLRASSLGHSGSVGQEKEGELATTSLEFEYLHWKSRCKMLIGEDDIRNDIITHGTCFSTFVYIHACFRFVLTGRNLTAQSTGSHREIGGAIQVLKM